MAACNKISSTKWVWSDNLYLQSPLVSDYFKQDLDVIIDVQHIINIIIMQLMFST